MGGVLGAIGKLVPQGLKLASQITAAAGAPPAVSQALAIGAQGAAQLGGLFAQG